MCNVDIEVNKNIFLWVFVLYYLMDYILFVNRTDLGNCIFFFFK